MHSTLIINPRAGRKGGIPTNRSGVDDVLAALGRHGIDPDVAETLHPGHATDLARTAARDGRDVVIAAGGDGTVREVAIGLIGTQVPLGIMPLGSVMNVARMLAIPRDIDGAAAVIAAGDCAQIDVGRAGSSYFLEAAGVGIDAALFHYGNEVDQGHWASLLEALRVAARYRARRFALELDGWTVEMDAMMVTIANGPYCGAAFTFAPDAKVDDHRLDVRVYSPMSKFALLWRLLRPRDDRADRRRVYTFRARDVRVTSPQPLPGHADSWRIGTTPLRFTLLPGALNVFVGVDVRDACAAVSRPPEHISIT